MDEMEEAVDLVNLYGIQTLPAGVAEQVDTLVRAAELTAEAMRKLRGMKDLSELLDRGQPAGERRRPVLPQAAGPPVLRRVRRADRDEAQGGRGLAGGRRRRLRARGQHGRDHRRQGVLTGALARPGHGGGRRPGVQLHQRLPRLGERHRHLGVHPGADPAGRAADGRGDEPAGLLHRAAARRRRGLDHHQGDHQDPGRRRRAVDRVLAARRGDRVERGDLVLRAALVLLARADRRHDRRGPGRRRHGGVEGRLAEGHPADGDLPGRRVRPGVLPDGRDPVGVPAARTRDG